MSTKKQRVTHTMDPRISILLAQLCKNPAFKGKYHGMTVSAAVEKMVVIAAKEELSLDIDDFYFHEGQWLIEVTE